VVLKGLVKHKNSFLRDVLNIIDVIIVVASFAYFSDPKPIYFAVKCMRPFKIVAITSKLAKEAQKIYHAIPFLANIFIFLLFIVFSFSVLGMHLF
jgi:hypothetical protein